MRAKWIAVLSGAIACGACIEYFAEPPGLGDLGGTSPSVDAESEEERHRVPATGPMCPVSESEAAKCDKVCSWVGDCAVSTEFCPGYEPVDRGDIVDSCVELCLGSPLLAELVCPHTMCQSTIDFVSRQVESFRIGCDGGGTLIEAQALINATCSPCHTNGNTRNGLNLDDISELIGRESTANVPYLTAGDHMASYIWHKMNGTQGMVGGAGSTMPLGRPMVSADDLAAFAAWIDGL